METKAITISLAEDDLSDIFLAKRAFEMAQIRNPLHVVTDGQEALSYMHGERKYADRRAHPREKLEVCKLRNGGLGSG